MTSWDGAVTGCFGTVACRDGAEIGLRSAVGSVAGTSTAFLHAEICGQGVAEHCRDTEAGGGGAAKGRNGAMFGTAGVEIYFRHAAEESRKTREGSCRAFTTLPQTLHKVAGNLTKSNGTPSTPKGKMTI